VLGGTKYARSAEDVNGRVADALRVLDAALRSSPYRRIEPRDLRSLDDTLMLGSRWAAVNGNAELFVAPDMPHGFPAFPCGITTAWSTRTNEWIAARL
jgi:acetyl esterase/lipase